MKQFIFDYYTGESLYEDVKEYTNFEHPYLLANGDQIAAMREEYVTLLEKYENGEIEEIQLNVNDGVIYSTKDAGEVLSEIYDLKISVKEEG